MIKGLIIDKTNDNAEYIKTVLENGPYNLSVKLDVLPENGCNFCITKGSEYDFAITVTDNISPEDLEYKIIPQLRMLSDGRPDNMILEIYRKMLIFNKKEIIGIEVMGKTCFIHTLTECYELGKITLTNLLLEIDDPCLVRCHKSYAINIRYLRGFRRETRTRWKPVYIIDTDFEGRVTDLFIDNVIDRYKEINGGYNIDLTWL